MLTLNILRGWVSVDATIAGDTFRFVSTHLESGSRDVQVAQATELLRLLGGQDLPTILVGDFNSPADGSGTPTYGVLVGAGFMDVWRSANPHDAGLTCCHQADLSNPTRSFSKRLDLILVRDGITHGRRSGFRCVQATLVGHKVSDRVAGLWPSDHAGVVATLRLIQRRGEPTGIR